MGLLISALLKAGVMERSTRYAYTCYKDAENTSINQQRIQQHIKVSKIRRQSMRETKGTEICKISEKSEEDASEGWRGGRATKARLTGIIVSAS